MRHVIAGVYMLVLVGVAASGRDDALILTALLLVVPLVYAWGKDAH